MASARSAKSPRLADELFNDILPVAVRNVVSDVRVDRPKNIEVVKRRIAELIAKETAGVFKTVADQIDSNMSGRPTALIAAQLAPGENWRQLDLAYTRRKQNTDFFVGPSDYRKKVLQKRKRLAYRTVSKAANRRLNAWLARINNATDILGVPQSADISVTITEKIVRRTASGDIIKIGDMTFEHAAFPNVNGSISRGIKSANGRMKRSRVDFPTNVVWQGLESQGFGDEKVGSRGYGKASQATYGMLLGRFTGRRVGFPYRPLIEPVLRYYAKKKIPEAINKLLRSKRTVY